MGLAPYGKPRYVDTIFENLIDLKNEGAYRLDMRYFDYATGLTMTSRRFDRLFGGRPRRPESELTQREMDLARSIQVVTEEVVLRLARTVRRETGEKNLCLAGGLNCVANGRLLRARIFDGLWGQPAAGDAGGALGAAFSVWHEYLENPRRASSSDKMHGSYLGLSFSPNEIAARLDGVQAVYEQLDDQALFQKVAELLAQGKVVGWFQGRMEFGPRAIDSWRFARSRNVVGDEPENQIPRVLPSIRALSAGCTCQRLL